MANGPAPSRKTVTALFCDVTGSTALGEQLDPESLREVIHQYFADMRSVIERHGGTVEKFIGDAVMAVFGVPKVHEDDALRAVRAAADMQGALAAANERFDRDFGVRIQARIGVNTGEVIAGDPTEEGSSFVSGDAVNVAARLEQAAEPGAVLLGESTYQLVRSAVIAEALEPITVKGKSEPLPVYRLVLVDPGAEMLPRRLDAPLVGRWDELELLRKTLGEVRSTSGVRLVTVVGEAGIGKSRLAHELVSIACDGARVLRGRCLPYGEGITFWPVAEILEDAAAIEPGTTAEATRSKMASLLPPEHQGLVDRLSALLGAGDAAGSIQETFLAVRRVLEALAAREPVVVIFDDIQWGEETFLDLIRYLASFLASSPVFIVCLARPELLESHADWSQSSELVRLRPLDGQGSKILVSNLLGKGAPADVATTIVQAAAGNPLFIEEMLRMLVDQGLLAVRGNEWVVTGEIGDFGTPETVHAVILARLDSLDAGEKAILQTASVMGEVFWWSAVAELTVDATPMDVARQLQALVRKDLIRPDPSMFFSEDAFRFGHLLIRDVAYEGLPKKSRASLHERFATWVAERAERSAEFDEIIGFHLESAHRYLTEVAPSDERLATLAVAAAHRLRAAGLRSSDRGDMPAAVTLLGRATALTSSDDPGRLLLMLEYADALTYAGRWREAEDLFSRAIEEARLTGALSIEYRAKVRINWLRMHVSSDLDHAEALVLAEPAVAYFEEIGDDVGLGMVLDFIGDVVFWEGQCAAAIGYYRRAIEHAERGGARRYAGESRHSICLALAQGFTPANEVIAELESMHREHEDDRVLLFKTHRFLAMMHALRGDFDRAREFADDAIARARELGMQVDLAGGSLREAATVATLEGDLQRAEGYLREGVEILQRIGDKGHLDSVASDLALLLLRTPGREREALEVASLADGALDNDADAQVRYRASKAVALVRLGQTDEAESLARDAVRRAWSTEYVFLRAVSQEALSEVLHRIGRSSEAAEAIEQAIATHEAKGNIVEAERDRRALADLRAAVDPL